MLKPDKQKLKYFLFSQYLADGLRVTLEVITPVIVFAQMGHMAIGLTVATGAFCTSICDIPGAVDSRRNGMLYAIGFIFIMSLLSALLNQHVLFLGLLVSLASFFFTMFSVYGSRAASVGTAALLIMVLRMPEIVSLQVALTDSLLIAAGGTWYLCIALFFYRLTPYRAAQRALGACLHETARFLEIKSYLYDINTDFDDEYRKLVTQQIVVNEKQDAAREILFKQKEMLGERSRMARVLVLTFADTVDLYEQITATWYDYKLLRDKFGATGLLDAVSAVIKEISKELDLIGLAIQSNTVYKSRFALVPALDELKKKIDLTEDLGGNNIVLKKILVNLRSLGNHIDELLNYFSLTISPKGRIRSKSDYSKFVSHQEIDTVAFRNNLNAGSAIFRHALRMMIACIAGFTITKLMSYGHHSYWILLTIIIILKPGYSLTRQRNLQRFAGTVAGAVIGLIILYFISDRDVLFGFIVFFMIGTYTFQRLNYIVMVIFTTPYILILLYLLGLGSLQVAEERLLDTGIACILSFLASYLLFPHWEAVQIETYMKQVLRGNIAYLGKLAGLLKGEPVSTLEYKLARKEVYISTANLAGAFNRMLSEPKNKQRNDKLIYEFVVLNHVLSSNIASLSAEMIKSDKGKYPGSALRQASRSLSVLKDAVKKLDKTQEINPGEETLLQVFPKNLMPDNHLSEQLDFIYKITLDIDKVARLFVA